jgi:hypothetical protein
MGRIISKKLREADHLHFGRLQRNYFLTRARMAF